MKESTKNLLRWVAVLPGALVSGLLATFILHWALYVSLVDGSIASGINIEPIERFLTPLVVAVAYVIVGYSIAPKYKFKVSVALSILWIVFVVLMLILLPAGTGIQASGFGGLLGLLIGMGIAWKKTQKTIEKSISSV